MTMDTDSFNAISPKQEALAFETLWSDRGLTLKKENDLFNELGVSSYVVAYTNLIETLQEDKRSEYQNNYELISEMLKNMGCSISVKGSYQYPERLLEARHPIRLFYFNGDIDLCDTDCVSVVGARQCTEAGAKRARKLAHLLVKSGFTVVSGLAAGIDTNALEQAIEDGGRVIGVIGTSIDDYYPKENRVLQDKIASDHLLISQVPFFKYSRQSWKTNRYYFPERNKTMSALSQATVIVEASDTSGTLTQAQACIQQGRKLFILDSCFENPDITWPAKYQKKGAIRVKDFSTIIDALRKP